MMPDSLVTITSQLYACDQCGALTLPDDRNIHSNFHEQLDDRLAQMHWKLVDLEHTED